MVRWIALAAGLLAMTAPATAQTQAAPAGTPITIGTSHRIASKVLGEEREVNVRLPASYASAKAPRRYPVLYLLDGGADQDFPHIAGLAQHGEISWTFDEFIVVGIATRKRIHELTRPNADERYVTFYRANGEAVEFASGGGGARFRRYVADEIVPFIESNYRTDGRRTLIGESLAAYFVVDTLLTEPRLFTDYVAVSPSLWWNREELGNRAPELLRGKDFAGRRLYVTMANEGGTMQRSLESLLAGLRSPASGALRWTYVDRRNSEHHGSIYHAAALDALRTLYPKPTRPGSPLPWLHVGAIPQLTEAAKADKALECTVQRARPATLAQVNADSNGWEALCVLTPLGQATEPREYSPNWGGGN